MNRPTDVAIVLRRWEYSETSQTVSALSREHGVIRGLAKGALRPASPFSGGFEPMTRGHLGWIVKSGRDLSILTEWMVEDVYWGTRRRPASNRAALYAVDLAGRILTDHDPHPDVFDALDAVLGALGDAETPAMPLAAYQWTVLASAGWRPVVSHDVETGEPLPDTESVLGFRPGDGGVVALASAGDWAVRRETIEALQAMERGQRPTDPAVATRASALLAAYTRELLGEQTEAMRQAFPDLR
ncbi:MAG: DNA repair protein RecO [Phycisphaerales bacterium]|jgi:DNA repair protein RecO (recombination protein O)|nr:DNA repair protein RecO [Phycisphaerales bacterium]